MISFNEKTLNGLSQWESLATPKISSTRDPPNSGNGTGRPNIYIRVLGRPTYERSITNLQILSVNYNEIDSYCSIPSIQDEGETCPSDEEDFSPVIKRLKKLSLHRRTTVEDLSVDELNTAIKLFIKEQHTSSRRFNAREVKARRWKAHKRFTREHCEKNREMALKRKDVVPHGLPEKSKSFAEILEATPKIPKTPSPFPWVRTTEDMKQIAFGKPGDPPVLETVKEEVQDVEMKEPSIVDGQFDDASEPSLGSGKIKARNELARVAASAQPFTASDPQLEGLLISVGELETWKEAKEFSEIDDWISHLENLVLLGYHMYKAQSFADIFAAVASYAKMNMKRSIVLELFKMVEEITSSMFDEVEKDSDVEPAGWKDWSGADVVSKWELFKGHTIFAKVSYLMTAAMSMTVCATKKIEWNPLGMKLISLEAAKEQLAAVDVIDALIKTFVWISDVGWKCIETRSIAPLLYSDCKMHEYNEICDYVIANAEIAVAGNLPDLGAYEKKLNHAFKRTCMMKSLKDSGATAVWLQKRYEALVLIIEKLTAKRRNTDIRMQPIGWSLSGPTHVGKTTLGKLTMIQSLAAMGFVDKDQKVDESRILTLDLNDQYQSTWTTDIIGVFMDDLGNAKAIFAKNNPHTSVIIKFFNNVAAQAIKAELNAKGCVFIDFKCGVITTNVKDLDARAYSNCPESILRRFFHVSVEIKKKFRKAGAVTLNKSHPEIRASKSLTHDVWNLKVEEVITYETAPGKTAYRFEPMCVSLDDGRTILCEDLDLPTYLDVVIQLATNHKADQDSLLHRSRKASTTKFCKMCKKFPEFCKCADHKVITDDVLPASVEMIGEVVRDAAARSFRMYMDSWIKPFEIINWCIGFRPIKWWETRQLAAELEKEMNRVGTPLLVSLMPQFLYQTRVFQGCVSAWQRSAAVYDIRWPLRIMGGIAGATFVYGGVTRNPRKMIGSLVCGSVGSCVGYYLHQVRLREIRELYLQKRDALPSYAKHLRDGNGPKAVLMIASVAVGVKLMTMWNAARLAAKPHGLTPEDVDSQPGWFGFMMNQLRWKAEASPTVIGATVSQAVGRAAKHLGYAEFTRSDGSRTGCGIVYPDKGIMWYPNHIWYPDSNMKLEPVEYLDVVVKRNDSKCSQIRFRAQLDYNTCVVPGKDMVQTFVPGCPDTASGLANWLPLSRPSGMSPCIFTTRGVSGKLATENVAVKYGDFGHKYMPMFGGSYTTKTAQNGSCMSMLVLDGPKPVITGFHIGGAPDRNYGVMMCVTKSEAESMIKTLLSLPGIRGFAKATDLPKEQYGMKLLSSDTVHPSAKFIVNRPPEASIDVYGSTQLRSQMKSQVVPSMLKEDVMKIFDVKQDYGPPALNPNWVGFNDTLEHIMKPSKMFMPSLLERARQDFLKPILAFAKTRTDTRVLTIKESIMGVPGVRFLDAMPMNTSAGKPLSGPKTKFFTDVFDGDTLVDRIPDPMIMEEYHRLEKCWTAGERAYPVAGATLKDNAVKVGSKKNRVFQSMAVAFGMHIRKRFLPLARLLSLCPLLSESAVGVNAFSPQWEELMQHAEQYAEDERVLAWDYKKYDVGMDGQMTYAALMCFIDIGEVVNYSACDLHIMNMMVADMIHPLMDYNGTMIMAYHMNTSGNNITVYINDIIGSLYIRMGFFNACPEVEDFRSAVAPITYGDDLKGSVKEEYRNRFNFRTMHSFLAKHDVTITDPNKEGTMQDDFHVDDVDFLKRQSVLIPELGYRIGSLSLDSMFKPLIAHMKSKHEPERNVAMSSIETFMHELFAHGRDKYDELRPKMQLLCALHQLPIPAVNYTFDERLAFHKEKYGEIAGLTPAAGGIIRDLAVNACGAYASHKIKRAAKRLEEIKFEEGGLKVLLANKFIFDNLPSGNVQDILRTAMGLGYLRRVVTKAGREVFEVVKPKDKKPEVTSLTPAAGGIVQSAYANYKADKAAERYDEIWFDKEDKEMSLADKLLTDNLPLGNAREALKRAITLGHLRRVVSDIGNEYFEIAKPEKQD